MTKLVFCSFLVVNENSTADCDPNREYYPPNFLSPLFLSALFLSDSGGLELLDWSGILDANWDVDELPPAARGRCLERYM